MKNAKFIPLIFSQITLLTVSDSTAYAIANSNEPAKTKANTNNSTTGGSFGLIKVPFLVSKVIGKDADFFVITFAKLAV